MYVDKEHKNMYTQKKKIKTSISCIRVTDVSMENRITAGGIY